MGSYNKHSESPGYRPGNHWVECDRCGLEIRAESAREEWTGMVVCEECFENRHPQDFVRARADDPRAKGLVRSEPDDDEPSGFLQLEQDPRFNIMLEDNFVVLLESHD